MPGTHSVKFLRSSNERAGITNAAQTGLNLTGDWTIESWVKATALVGNADRYTLCGKYNSASQRSYLISFQEEGSSEYRVYTTVSGNGVDTYDQIYWQPGLLQPGANSWFHYAWTYDISESGADASYKYYIMGELQTVVKVVTISDDLSAIHDGTADFQVGANSYLGTNFSSDMQVDELRVWNIVRTQAQIRSLMDSQAVGNESGLQGCWHFDNDYVDATSNGNDLTPVNTPTFVSADVGGLRQVNGVQAGQLAGAYSSPVGGLEGTIVFAGAGADTTAPVISNVTPTASAFLAADYNLARATPIELDVTDLNPGVTAIVVSVKYTKARDRLVAYDGTRFVPPFNSTTSAVTAISNGYHVKILPVDGWPDTIEEMFVYATDGNVEALPL